MAASAAGAKLDTQKIASSFSFYNPPNAHILRRNSSFSECLFNFRDNSERVMLVSKNREAPLPVGRKQRRENLIAAARRAVITHGADVRLKDVAEEAGLTSGAILYHFPNVQTLLVEANRAGMERFHDERLRTIERLTSPEEKLFVTISLGLPRDADDEAVKLFCELGGASGRHPVYAAMMTSLYDRQVSMYQIILESGAATGSFTLAQSSEMIARNIVALEDAYGYRMVAHHPTITHDVGTQLILGYARLATSHPLDSPTTSTSTSKGHS